MINRFSGLTRPVALVLVISGALAGMGWLWWDSARNPDINFLPKRAPAEWIVSPSGAEVPPRARLELSTLFERSFVLENAPARADLRVAGFHQYSMTVNGAAPPAAMRRGRNWKEPDQFEVAGLLRRGENRIVVRVWNSNGPPALWLSLDAASLRLNSDESWHAACAGALRTAARLATKPKPAIQGGLLSGGEQPWTSLRARWPTLLLFAILSGSGYCLMSLGRRGAGGDHRARTAAAPSAQALADPQAGGNWCRDVLPVIGLAGLWVALFANNLTALPPLQGFDLEGHLAYVNHILERHSLPRANEGWEMFQPPLYYLMCAGLLKVLGLGTWQDGGVAALRVMGLTIGVAHFVIVWAGLGLLFPGEQSKQRSGLVLAAALPPLLYLSQYITNEALAAALVSACVCFTLRILKQETASWTLTAGLGLCLGAALLTKSTALLAVPVILGAFLWKAWLTPRPDAPHSALRILQVGVVLGVCVAVCGWHYARLWEQYGSPLVGLRVPRTGFSWWQDDGYRTGAFYLRFGQALVHPWFSSFQSFGDGMYATLWGDGLLGGSGDFLCRAPWNYDLMGIGYWLALVPTCALMVGGILALANFLRRPSAQWFMVLGLGFLVGLAVVHRSVAVPYHCMVKAFYGLSALVPLCACCAWGLDAFGRWSGKLRPMIWMVFGVWAINSYAAFWVSRSAIPTVLARARSLVKAGREIEAAQTLKARVQVDPQSAETRALLADILTSIGEGKEAVKQAELAVRENPNDANHRLVLSLALTQENRISEAIEQAQKVVELAPGDGRAYPHLATLLIKQKRYDEAIQVSRAGLDVTPFDPELRFALGTALVARNEAPEGMAQLQLAAGLKPAVPATSAGRGPVPPDQSARDEPAGTPASEAGSRVAEASQHTQLAAALLNQGKLEEASGQYRAALAIEPRSETARCGLGQALSKQGRYEEAIEQFLQALQLKPTDVLALVQLGMARARLGKPDQAVEALTEALRIDPGDADAYNSLGNVLAQQGKHEEAVQQFEEAVRLNPGHAAAHNNLAISCRKLGRIGEAMAHYREAIRLQPHSLPALNNLAWLLAAHPDAQFRNGAEAVGLATRACELTKYQNPVPLATLAAAYGEAGKFHEAVSFAERAQELASGGQPALAARLAAMLEVFRAGRPYHAD